MSVINTMLRDLERRGAAGNMSDAILDGLTSGASNYNDTNTSSKLYMAAIMAAIIIVGLVAVGYYVSPYKLVNSSNVNHAYTSTTHESISHKTVNNQVAVLSEKHVPAASAAISTTNKKEITEKTPVHSASVVKHVIVSSSTVVRPPKSTIAVPVSPVSKVSKSESRQIVHPVVAKVVTAKKPASDIDATNGQVSPVDSENGTDELGSSSVVKKQQVAFTPAEKSKQAYASALDLYNDDRKQEAKSYLTSALTLDQGNIDACRLLSVIYLQDGRADLAAKTLESGLDIHGSAQDLLRLYVQTLATLGKYTQAIAVMSQRVQVTSPDDLGYLAGLYQKDHDHMDAVKYYAEALQLVPHKSIWWLGQAVSLEVLKQYKSAMQAYEKSVSTGELSSNLAEYAISRIKVLKQRGADPSP